MSVQIKGVGTIGGLDEGLNITGIVTATSFVGNGANLTGIDATSIKHTDGNVKAQAIATGVNVTGNLEATGNLDLTDSGRVKLGTGDDLQMYHSGSGNFVDVHTNHLQFRTSGTTELMAEFKLNNAVDLYYDGTKRFETKVNGAQVNGTTLFIRGGSGEDSVLQFIANNSASYNDHYNFRVAASGAFSLQTEVNANQYENMITATQNGNVELYHDNTKRLETLSDGVKITGRRLNITDTGSVDLYLSADTDNSDESHVPRLHFVQDGSATRLIIGCEGSGGTAFSNSVGNSPYLETVGNVPFVVATDSVGRWQFTSSGHFYPMANNTYDIGSSSYRARNIYTADLHCSNKGSTNDVDGTWGDYTIQEGESDLFLINNRSGKKYKFNLTEVS